MDKTNNSGLNKRTKKKHMTQLQQYRDDVLRPHPELRSLFFELTVACNEHCRHCGSQCGDVKGGTPLTPEDWKAVLDSVKKDFDITRLNLNITGGEPLLYPGFFEVTSYASSLGFLWGMTSNGTLITPEVAKKLHEAGMKTISISVDGLRETHDWFRESEGSYDKTMAGIKNLLNEGGFLHVQVTTVVHHRNISELPALYEVMKNLGIRSWRVINIEPIGRARNNPDLMLTKNEYKTMFDFIRKHRFEDKMEITYGCSHFLGTDLEREVRKWYFLCNAGVYTASIMHNGDVVSCLDIERRPELIEGNVKEKPFKEIWDKGFKIYRSDYRKCGKCEKCKDYKFCAGDSFHTWDFDKMEPIICMRDMLK